MEIIKICLVAVIACIICLYMQSTNNKEYALYISLISGLIILSFSFNYISAILDIVKSITDRVNFSSEQLKTTLEIIITSYIAQFASDICVDANQKSLSTKIDIAAKFIILYLSLPIIITFFNYLNSISI